MSIMHLVVKNKPGAITFVVVFKYLLSPDEPYIINMGKRVGTLTPCSSTPQKAAFELQENTARHLGQLIPCRICPSEGSPV